MTPDEHYREAERYLGKWQDYDELALAEKLAAAYPRANATHAQSLLTSGIATAANLLAAAQVHATLATLGMRQDG